MIRKQIHKPENLSADSVFQIIEIYLTGQYKTIRQSDSKLKIKRLYNYQSNGWETIQRQLSFRDSGYFQMDNNYFSFSIDLTKQIVFWTLMAVSGMFILWKLFHLSFLLTLILIFVPLLIGWSIGLYGLKQFVDLQIDAISKRLND
jgi:hypothetical protein